MRRLPRLAFEDRIHVRRFISKYVRSAERRAPSAERRAPSAITFWRFRAVRYLLGLFLLATCGLKVFALSSSTPPQPGWLGSSRIQLIAIQWEFFLGIWLLSGVRQSAAWLTSLATFLTFAGISGSLVWAGVAKCPCFGFSVNPWFAFGSDLAALLMLATSPPREEKQGSVYRHWLHSARPIFWTFILVGTLFGVGAAAASWTSGSVLGATAWFRGEPLYLNSDYVDFGRLLLWMYERCP